MGRLLRYALTLATVVAIDGFSSKSCADGRLPITPVVQGTHQWCWLAVGEMVFRYYGVPNANPYGRYQCGIVGILAGPDHVCWNNCSHCSGPAGSFISGKNWKQTMLHMFEAYPEEAEKFTRKNSPRITVSLSEAPLTRNEIALEIDERRPVIAGVSPFRSQYSGVTQHVVLIVGYRHADGKMILIVNEPYPYSSGSNPFLATGGRLVDRRGQYEIEYDAFKRGLLWAETLYRFEAQ